MVKVHKMVCIDQDVNEQMKARGVNISGVCNDYLRTLLKPNLEEEKDKLFEQAYKLNEEAKQIEQALEEQEKAREIELENAKLMQEEEKAGIRAQIVAERNSPERIARREALKAWASDPRNKTRTKEDGSR